MGKRRRSGAAAAGPSAVGAPTEGQAAGKGQGNFRFWHDERRFKGPGSVCVVQEALFAAGGVRTGGYPKAAPIAGPLGFQRPGDWDLLWSPARLALRAVPNLKPGQLISSSPGMMSLTRKRKLPATLHAGLGSAAWAVTPHSFVLPDELPALRAHMAVREAAGAGDELWILKTAQHLGKGLKLLPATELCAHASNRHVCVDGGRTTSKPYVLAQRYVDNPLLVQGRKFGIRVWVLVLGPNPMRAYLHANGLVLFATHGYDGSDWRGESGSVALGHVTNYAQNVDGTVWDLEQLKQHLGEDAFGLLWSRIATSAAMMCSSALGPMRADHAALKVPAEAAFELLGLDYLVDTSLHPWLLEVNGTPSLAVDHSQPEVEQLIHTQKAGMTRDMFNLLGVSTRFHARYEAMRLAAKQTANRKAAGKAAASAVNASATVDKRDQDGDNDESEVEGSEDGEDEPVHRRGGKASGHRRALVSVDSDDDEEMQSESVQGNGTSSTGGINANLRAIAIGQTGGAAGPRGGWPVGAGARGSSGGSSSGSGGGARTAGLAAGAAGQPGPAGAIPLMLPKRIRELLSPRSDQAIRARVAQELSQRGAFQPLMELFPMPLHLSTPGPVQPSPAATAAENDDDDATLQAAHSSDHSSGDVAVLSPPRPASSDGSGGAADGGAPSDESTGGTASAGDGVQQHAESGSTGAGAKDMASPSHFQKHAGSLELALQAATIAGQVPWAAQDVALRRTLVASQGGVL